MDFFFLVKNKVLTLNKGMDNTTNQNEILTPNEARAELGYLNEILTPNEARAELGYLREDVAFIKVVMPVSKHLIEAIRNKPSMFDDVARMLGDSAGRAVKSSLAKEVLEGK